VTAYVRILRVVADLALHDTRRASRTISLASKSAGHEVALLAHSADGHDNTVLDRCG
jgi:hypothetical protein